MAKRKAEELSREEPITLIYEMAKKINELEAEIARLKQPTNSKNSSQPPSRVTCGKCAEFLLPDRCAGKTPYWVVTKVRPVWSQASCTLGAL